MNGARQDRDDRKLDALIALAMERRQEAEPDFSDLAKLEAHLTEEDRKALEKPDADFISDIVSGRAESVSEDDLTSDRKTNWVDVPELELAGAMNRSEDEELTEKAKEEIERRIREEHESRKKKKPTDDGSSPAGNSGK